MSKELLKVEGLTPREGSRSFHNSSLREGGIMSKEICTIDGTKWLLGDEAPERMNWCDAVEWCESIGQQLPPREVLLMAYMNPKIRRGFAKNFYWSSSVDDNNYAWIQSFGDGSQYYDDKYYSLPVRAVRAIKGLTPRQGLEEFKKGYAKAELDLKREPLSNEEIRTIVSQLPTEIDLGTGIEFCSIIEKAHGITGGEE